MKTLILSTCGTSLLTNLCPENRALIYEHANVKTPEAIPRQARDLLQAIVDQLDEKLRTADSVELGMKSAELNGILCYYDGQLGRSHDIHWLIATDTWLGEATAQAICRVLEKAGHQAKVQRISDLQTANLESFRAGISDLTRLCAQEVKGMREGGYRVVFNLTGGFKSVQGFMQALGMLYADESVYVFEGSSELLRLPRLPIELDAPALVRKHERLFRRYAAKLPISLEDADADDVPETLLMRIGDGITLSVWGDAIWNEAGKQILGEKLWPSLDVKLRYHDGFEKTLQHCSKMEMGQVNERLGDLARYLKDKTNPSRLDFKPLHGTKGKCTHECDAWAQGGAKRLFGYFDGGVFVVVELAEGLH